ncbi:DUF3883 domain-containing protein [Acidobacteria bacterium AH-259-A15]|nr:DUF3883 domain-containing protein [Acidobacteria bacterium AH-259-A15]
MVFSSNREGGQYNLFWKAADGTGQVERLTTSPNSQYPYSFSSDGKRLVFVENSPETSRDLHLLSMDGEPISEPLLQTQFYEGSPAISPDGRWMAYYSNDYTATEDESITHKSVTPVEVSSILYLTQLMNSSRKSRSKSIQLLRFLLTFVVSVDKYAFTTSEVACECEQSHRYHRTTGWLSPLKNNSWIWVGKNRSAKPSAESLARLLPELKDSDAIIRESRRVKLIEHLGVSPAELSLRSLSEDENTRLSFVTSLSDLARAVRSDPSRLRDIATEVRNNPTILDAIEEQKHRRERVQTNQEVGNFVEALLKQALGSKGLKVKRTGVGSDFEVENDVTENDQEVWFEVGKSSKTYLIEVKATTRPHVRMTPKQVETATKEHQRFLLCVVPLRGGSVTKDEVEQSCRFVSDIGEKLKPLWKEFGSLQSAQEAAQTKLGGIELELTESKPRFRINRDIWSGGKQIADLVGYVQSGQ